MNYIDELCIATRTHGASDLYLLENAIPQIRLGGTWTDLGEKALTPEELEVFWMEAGGSSTALDQDCSHVASDGGRFRVNLFRSLGRRGAVMRQIKMTAPVLSELGVPTELMASWIENKSGLMLVTGRTGSGKSTTLAACLEWLNTQHRRHIVTIEDPIEFLFKPNQCLFSQREVGTDTSSFAEGLRRALRQSPDVIMVGEIRDADSAKTALQAAETGHLVVASVHSQNVPETIERLMQMFPVNEREAALQLLAAQVIGIISQYLAPAANGGLVLICEYLQNSALSRKWIKEGKLSDLTDLIAKGDPREMQSFLASLVEMCKAEVITEQTALELAPNAQEFSRLMRGICAGSGSARR